MRKYLYFIIGIAFTIYGCTKDSFLNREPLDAINDATFFSKVSDFKSYATGLASSYTQIGARWGRGANTDDLLAANPSGNLMLRNNAGLAPNTSAVWNDRYTFIRNANFLINNVDRLADRTAAANHYIGEAYYTRAYSYFVLLQEFGGVPIITKSLNTTDPELYTERSGRFDVAKLILADLDSAIKNLDWKGVGEAVPGRLNKESALTMKTRVALFEGTWERYHGKAGTPFAVQGKDGSDFLQECVNAGNLLIDKQGVGIYKTGSEAYKDLFTQDNYANVAGAFLYIVYDRGLSKTQDWNGAGIEGFGLGATQEMVDQYLMKDGAPQEISSLAYERGNLRSTGANKDPRFRQTIWDANSRTFFDYFGANQPAGHQYHAPFPGFKTAQQRQPITTGWRIIKGIPLDPAEWRNGQADEIILRYAEALLNYIEAKAILNQATQADIDKTINLIRSRINMANMNLATVNSWNYTYQKKFGYDPTEPKIVNEIRRERRVELAFEGLRDMDLQRWAIKAEVYNSQKPEGAKIDQFLKFWNNVDSLNYYGFNEATPANVRLIIGTDIDSFATGFINPFFRNADFRAASGLGYYIDPARDYLSGIPRQEVELYKTKANIVLTQNPGWN
ncbi:RagB/SusD family nutrient uptake outer membrane protein [Niabella insulamsoli]|uniref:RagB/SusD family nutrient uptake outer membrane protein n=1 Tax=Niabella insulamsoli TaxID=3144874 RepID=UPI0031FBD4F9